MDEIAYLKDVSLSILERLVVTDVYEDSYRPRETAGKIIAEISHFEGYNEGYASELTDFIIKYYCRFYFVIIEMVKNYDGPVTLNVTWHDNKEFLKKIKEKLETTTV